MKKINSFEDLILWQKAHSLTLHVYKVTKHYPDFEKFGLSNQQRRCSVSVSSNIAEGFTRYSKKEKKRFFTIAKSSLYELKSQVYIARDLNFISIEQSKRLLLEITEVAKLLSTWIRKIS